MAEQSQWIRGALIMGGLLAAGMVISASILGYNARLAASQKQSVLVKGLAEKPVKADRAELELVLTSRGATAADALAKLREQRPKLEAFLTEQKLTAAQIEAGGEDFSAVPKRNDKGMTTEEVDYYAAAQQFTLRSKDVGQIARAERATLKLREAGMALRVGEAQYLVSDLEAIKMSLIGSATQNAFARAGEFARNGNAKVGAMKAAQQGAFYILPATGKSDSDSDYGGVYDKKTIDKIARVVVTIEYAIQP